MLPLHLLLRAARKFQRQAHHLLRRIVRLLATTAKLIIKITLQNLKNQQTTKRINNQKKWWRTQKRKRGQSTPPPKQKEIILSFRQRAPIGRALISRVQNRSRMLQQMQMMMMTSLREGRRKVTKLYAGRRLSTLNRWSTSRWTMSRTRPAWALPRCRRFRSTLPMCRPTWSHLRYKRLRCSLMAASYVKEKA